MRAVGKTSISWEHPSILIHARELVTYGHTHECMVGKLRNRCMRNIGFVTYVIFVIQS